MKFDFHVHGLLILGSITFFIAVLMIKGIDWTTGTTDTALGTSLIISIAAVLITGILWISSAINATEHH